MAPAATNKVGSTQTPQRRERASARIILLALVSFLLGMAATAVWFHLAARQNAESPAFETDGQSPAGQPAAPMVSAQSPVPPAAATRPPVDATAIEDVKRAIPNLASVPEADGEKILRAAALKEFAAAAKEMDAQIKAAQQQLLQTENEQSAAEQQAAMKHLQQTQAAQAEKLQQIAARLQLQIAALKKLKNQE